MNHYYQSVVGNLHFDEYFQRANIATATRAAVIPTNITSIADYAFYKCGGGSGYELQAVIITTCDNTQCITIAV